MKQGWQKERAKSKREKAPKIDFGDAIANGGKGEKGGENKQNLVKNRTFCTEREKLPEK